MASIIKSPLIKCPTEKNLFWRKIVLDLIYLFGHLINRCFFLFLFLLGTYYFLPYYGPTLKWSTLFFSLLWLIRYFKYATKLPKWPSSRGYQYMICLFNILGGLYFKMIEPYEISFFNAKYRPLKIRKKNHLKLMDSIWI